MLGMLWGVIAGAQLFLVPSQHQSRSRYSAVRMFGSFLILFFTHNLGILQQIHCSVVGRNF